MIVNIQKRRHEAQFLVFRFLFRNKPDLGSMRSSPRNGLSTSYRLTIWNNARLAHKILVSAQGPLVMGFWVFGFGALGFGAWAWQFQILRLSRLPFNLIIPKQGLVFFATECLFYGALNKINFEILDICLKWCQPALPIRLCLDFHLDIVPNSPTSVS